MPKEKALKRGILRRAKKGAGPVATPEAAKATNEVKHAKKVKPMKAPKAPKIKRVKAPKPQKVKQPKVKQPKAPKQPRKRMFKAKRASKRWIFGAVGNSKNDTLDNLLNAESALGRTIFGPIPEGCQREFFEYRKNVWIWYESFRNPMGVLQEMVIRYEVRPDGVYKRPGDGNYRKIEGFELENFRMAARMYLDLIKTRLYY